MPDDFKGNCYQVHIDFLREAVEPQERAGWRLCHGTVTNAQGKAMGHCWLEHGGYAYDFSNGNYFRMEVDEFRRLTQARDVSVYTSQEVSVNILTHGHLGPWP